MIKQEQLLAKYDDKTSNYFLLDVRTPFEYQERHLPGSVNIPIDSIEENLTKIPLDRHIITICAHGVRSGIAEKFLRAKSYHADSLEGGLALWKGQTEKEK